MLPTSYSGHIKDNGDNTIDSGEIDIYKVYNLNYNDLLDIYIEVDGLVPLLIILTELEDPNEIKASQ